MSRILLGKGDQPVYLLAKYGNRHGLVAGATGTGKTVSLMQAVRRVGSQVGRQILRGVLGGVLGGSRRR